MRVVLVGPGFAPDTGGVETHLDHLARGLHRHGVDVEVWVPARSDRVAVTEWRDGILVRRHPATKSHRFPMAPALWRRARALVGTDVVLHVQSYHNTAALAALYAPAATPVIFTPHYHGGGHTALASLLHRPYRLAGGRVMARAATVVTVSEAERSLVERDFPEVAGRVRVSHNGADVEAIHAATPFPDEPPTVLVAGRLERYKQTDAVLAAFGAASAPGRLVITGDGPDRSRLQALARSSPRRADIVFAGRVPDDELRRWQRTARGLVSLSQHEAFGLVALEIVAAGGRALLSPIPAHREVATLCPPGAVTLVDAAGLTAELDALLAGPPPGPARSVRSWDDLVDDHLAIYEDARTR